MSAADNENAMTMLHGLTVLEFDDGPAEFAGKLLAHAGADVIKIEPACGAGSRTVGPFAHDERGVDASLQFGHYNTSKRSVVADLASGGDTDRLTALVERADVVLDGMGVGALESLGLRYSDLRQANPALVWCSVTPFGVDGPWSGFAASDITQLALGGVMASCGYDEGPTDEPVAPSGGHAKHLAGVLAAMATLAAVVERHTSGEGQFIDLSTHESIAVSTEMAVPFWLYQQREVERHTARHAMPADTPRWQHRCADGKYFLALPLYIDDSRFADLVEWFDSEGMAEDLADERYSAAEIREDEMFHIVDVIGRFCAQHDSEYMFRESQARRLPWAPVNSPDELLHDDHFTAARATFVAIEDGWGAGRHWYPQMAHVIGQEWAGVRAAPLLGQHTDEVMGPPLSATRVRADEEFRHGQHAH